MSTKFQNQKANEAINWMGLAQQAINAGDRATADDYAQRAQAAAQMASNATVAAAVVNHANSWGPVQPPPSTPQPQPQPQAQPQPQGGGGGGSAPAPTPGPAPTIYKNDIILTPAADPPKPVKIPDRDVLEFNRTDVSPSGIATLLFEAVGGTEIISLVRRDTVEGQNPYYDLISNLSSITKQYEPTQLIARQKPNQTIFDLYAIDLNRKIPTVSSLRDKKLQNFFYIDTNGDLVVELDNMFPDELIQLEIAGSGTIISESLS
jgi:hypothetical protein